MPKEITTILVSQPKPSNEKSPYFQLMEETGVQIDFKQLFKITPVTSREFRDQKIEILDHTGVVLSSKTMADHFFKLVKELRIELPEDYKYYCSTDFIASYLQKHITVRKRKVFYPEKNGNGGDLLSLLLKYNKERFFVPSIGGIKDRFSEELEASGVSHSMGVISKLEFTPVTKDEIGDYDMLIFFSPNGVQSLFHSIPDYEQGDQLIGCLGEGTLKALKEAKLRVDMPVPNKEFTSINAALEHMVKKHKKKHA